MSASLFVPSVFLSSVLAPFLTAALLLRRPPRRAGALALRGGLVAMFLVTGTTHFVALRDDLIAIVPPALPAPELLVTVTGVLELLGAVGLLLPATAAWAAGWLALLLLAMFPANVYAAASGAMLGGDLATALVPRAALQALYVGAAVAVVVTSRRVALRPSTVRRVTLRLPRAFGPAHRPGSADGAPGVVLVSRLELRSVWDVPGFLRASLGLRRVLRTAPGAVFLELAAQPLARTFWTWSGWTDEAAMREFTAADAHLRVMGEYRARMQASRFRILTGAEAPTGWPDVERLLSGRQAARR